MKRTWNLSGIFAGMGMLVLIFDSRLALEGAREGLELCIRTVIPSLFPFIVLSMVMTRDTAATKPWLRPLTDSLGIPENAQSVLVPAFLGGYPVGAKCVHELWIAGKLTKAQAERMLGFCSNAGPAFLFGILSGFFPDRRSLWLLWLIHLFSAVLSGLALSPVDAEVRARSKALPKTGNTDILLSAMKAMGAVCGWVMLFRIAVTVLLHWFGWYLPQWVMVLVTGMLELTNGCCELMQISNLELRFVICASMLAFGGCCVLLQTASVTKGLGLRCYVLGKSMQTGFSLLLSCAVVWQKGWLLMTAVPLFVLFLRRIQKSSGNPEVIPV